MTTAPSAPALALRLPRGGRWLLGLVVPLHCAGDVSGKDRLQPLSGAAADDPSVSGGHGASKAGGKSGSTQGKAFVPGHGRMIPGKEKCAMRKIKPCNILRNAYSLRMSNTNHIATIAFFAATDVKTKTEILTAIAKHYGISESEALEEVTDEEAEHLLDYLTGSIRTDTSILMKRHNIAA